MKPCGRARWRRWGTRRGTECGRATSRRSVRRRAYRPRARGAARLSAVAHPGAAAAPIGREGVENVTWGSRRLTIPSPMPATRLSASREPKGPQRSRLVTIRSASAGPIHGNPSIVAALATSRSTFARDGSPFPGDAGARGLVTLASPFDPDRAVRVRLTARALSTRAICASRARTCSGVATACSRVAPLSRAATPSTATTVSNTSARRSDGVGMRAS